MYLTNVNKYFLYQYLKNSSFWLPVFTLYLLDAGLDYAQILTLLSVQSVSQVVCELPTGVVSDFFGRKTMLFLSALLKTLSIAIIYGAESFPWFCIAYVLMGFSFGAESGSDIALIYDSLKHNDQEWRFKSIEGRAYAFGLTGRGVGALAGGLIATRSLGASLVWTLVSYALSIAVAATFREPPIHSRDSKERRGYISHLNEAVTLAIRVGQVRWLLLYQAALFVTSMIAFRYYQPYLRDLGVGVGHLGLIYFSWMLVAAFAARMTQRMEDLVGGLPLLVLMGLFSCVSHFSLGVESSFWGVLCVYPNQLSWGLLRPVINDRVNRLVGSSTRATVLSLGGLLQSAGLAVLAPLFGFVADAGGIRTSARLLAFTVLICCGCFVFNIYRESLKDLPNSG